MNKQDYKKIEYTAKEIFTLKKKEIVTYKIKNYKNVYVSNTCHIKPKGLHIILKNVNEAITEFDIVDNEIKIIIISFKDGINSLGMYDAMNDEIYLNEVISDKYKLVHENIELGHVERHEVWHLKQALIYRTIYKNISQNNYSHYLDFINRRAKRYLDSLGANVDNVSAISKYAYKTYIMGRFDEAEAEIKAKKGGARCIRISQKKWKNYLTL